MVKPPAFKSRRFVMYWIGHLISFAGSQMQLWAMYWHLRTLSDQPMVISVIGLVRFLPIIVLSLLAESLRWFDRRKMTDSDPGLLWDWWHRSWLEDLVGYDVPLDVIWTGGCSIVATAFDVPARQALIPSLFPPERPGYAYSLTSIAGKVGGISDRESLGS